MTKNSQQPLADTIGTCNCAVEGVECKMHASEDVCKKSKGVLWGKYESNPVLATRDYFVQCVRGERIALFRGYHIWWCESHYQPMYICEAKRNKEELQKTKDDYEKLLDEFECSDCKTEKQKIRSEVIEEILSELEKAEREKHDDAEHCTCLPGTISRLRQSLN